jgi:hypothetical protein
MSYERDRHYKDQEATEEMIRMRTPVRRPVRDPEPDPLEDRIRAIVREELIRFGLVVDRSHDI